DELVEAINNANVGTIILRSETRDAITIASNENAKGKKIVIDVPYATVTNKAKFKYITVSGASMYKEAVSGNTIEIPTYYLANLELAKKKSIKKLVLTGYTGFEEIDMYSIVRKGAKKAVIEGLFEVKQTEALMQVFEDLGIDYDDEIIITKEILLSGKSTVKINYRHATNNALKMLAPLLIHLHSQFETQTLFAPAHHITLLDQFQEDSLKPLKKQYDALYEEYQDIYKKRRQLEEEDFSD
ncbi:MAG: hypothetical protein ACSW8B_02565, partial [bacterium]